MMVESDSILTDYGLFAGGSAVASIFEEVQGSVALVWCLTMSILMYVLVVVGLLGCFNPI